ncbi:MAG: N4-gp56 family major capsid protein [Oscillospiraceae bacterium]|nr:N4-gp56 family major capsid protein [Oscillospiraceae bacterium]
MADVTNTLANTLAENKVYYERTLLKRLVPNLLFARFGQKKSMPQNEGDKISFRRFNSIAPSTTPLTEGVTPAGKALDVDKVECTVQQYGDFVRITDKLKTTGIDPVLIETANVLGESAALTIDTVVRDVVCAGTNVQYAGGRANRDAVTAADVITSGEIRKAVRTLKRNNARPLEGGYYIGIIDSDIAYDIMNDPLWQDISKYSGGSAIMSGEIGKLAGVRFIESSNAPTAENTSGIVVHQTMILGADAYGVVDVAGAGGGAKPEMIVKPLGSAGTDDPLNQRATSGWKALFCAVRLQELSMVRLESAATL